MKYSNMRCSYFKIFLMSLGNLIVMYLLIHPVVQFLLDRIDFLSKYTFLFDALVIIWSSITGCGLSFVIKKFIRGKAIYRYVISSVILLLFLLGFSYALIPTMLSVVPQFMTTYFLIPGIIIQFALLTLQKFFKQRDD